MIEAGIFDGDNILFQNSESLEDGAIMLVKYKNKMTVKRIMMKEGQIYLCWDDGSNRQMMVDSEDYEVQGKFMAIERRPGKR
jgi:SOS-response transcriptional repressor LexA